MIVPLSKITLCGLLREKAKILDELQTLGCLHLIPLSQPPEHFRRGGPTSEAREALKFLLDCPQRLRQIKESSVFDAIAVETRALELKARQQELEDERDFLLNRLADLQPWGDFSFPLLEDTGGLRLWFYTLPPYQLARIPGHLTYHLVHQDNRFAYVIVLAPQEPEGMPVPRTHTGSLSPQKLKNRLETVELELEDVQLERTSLTRWCTLFARDLDRLEDVASLYEAVELTLSSGPLFALQAWVPRDQMAQVEALARNRGLVFQITAPRPGETPPTLLQNHPALASGQDLVSFYTTPGYWEWDPSVVVLFSFSLFFAMILADAGYGLLLGGALLTSWRRLGQSPPGRRFRPFLLIMVVTSVLYGTLVNSYFGVSAPPGTLLARLGILNLNDFSTMMGLSIAIGIGHLILANLADAWTLRRSLEVLAPLGWVLIFVGASAWAVGQSALNSADTLTWIGLILLSLGGLGVLGFTTVSGPWWRRLWGGFLGLTRLAYAFGDTLSYLRLFALGLASASLAINFNLLAKQVHDALPGLGLFFSLLIILIGHGLNLILGLASGCIHGLRLNFIEFFNWGLREEGSRFQAFVRKEKS